MNEKFRRRIYNTDVVLVLVTVILVAFGFLCMSSASFPEGLRKYGSGYYFIKRQFIFLILGIVVCYLSARFPRTSLTKIAFPLFMISLLLMACLWVPGLQSATNGSIRWIKIPKIGFRFQPSDIMKLTSLIYLAHYLSNNLRRIKEDGIFTVAFAVIALAVGPIMLRDFSTAVVVGAALFFVYVTAGLTKKQLAIMFILGIIFVAFMLFNENFEYRFKRLLGFISKDPQEKLDDTYQVYQGLYAIAMGGYSGVGLFHSRQKYSNLPEAYTDYIFCVICEEFGVLGAVFLVLLFFIFIYRGFMVAYKAKNPFDKLLAVGITTSIGVQAFFNIGVNIRVLPSTGLTLPFISYGGTALVMTLAAVGLLLRISKDVERS